MTDDLDMGAIIDTTSFEDMLALGLAAGNDLLMICHRVELLEQARVVLETQPADLLAASLGRVAVFKMKMAPPADFSPAAFEAINRDIWELRVATLGEEKAREKSLEDGKRSPVELY
jgi:beta-N-acetylhexosaminidase